MFSLGFAWINRVSKQYTTITCGLMIEGTVLARNWLTSKFSTVKQFNNRAIGSGDKGLKGSNPEPNSYRSIANFLSKNKVLKQNIEVPPRELRI